MTRKSTSVKKQPTKKDLVLGNTPPKRKPYLLLATIAIVVFAAGVGYTYFQKSTSRPVRANSVTVPAAANTKTVSFDLSLFDDGQARHFDYAQEGITIRYFILKSSDGVVRAAFDVCDVCWQAGKGYFQQGDVMVCGNCGRQFPSVRINEIQGGCNPAPLFRSVSDGQLTVRIEDIVQGRGYFDLNRRG